MIEVPETGAILAGKYRVLKVLGEGGMGIVVAALHLELDQMVAVKFLHHAALGNSEALARFTREARAAARIKSEHVARVIDVSRLENGAPYMVMEYLEGEDLAARSSSGPLPVEDAADYVVQACDAVAEAHAAGIIHRDLKPSNLFLTQRANGEAWVKVLDFGISKLLANDVAQAGLTSTAALMGSPLYMSPEQMRSARDVDARTDLWALGAILYELLSAHPPFMGESLPEVINAVMACEPLPLRHYRQDVPPELERTILRCLAKDPNQRLQSIAELATELAAFVPRRSQHVVARVRSFSKPPSQSASVDQSLHGAGGSVGLPAHGSAQITAPPWSGTHRGVDYTAKPERRSRWLVTGTLLLLGAGVSLALGLSRSPAPSNGVSSGSPALGEPARSVAPPPRVTEPTLTASAEPTAVKPAQTRPALPRASSTAIKRVPPSLEPSASAAAGSATPASAEKASDSKRHTLDIHLK